MGRKKVRKYPSRECYELMLEQYFANDNGAVITYVIEKIGEDPAKYGFCDLQEDERRMRWGFDCGWILMYPTNKEMAHEWELDSGGYGAYVWTDSALPWCPQSTTLKRIMLEKAVEDLELQDEFWLATKLD